jgi:hypothetical protein
MEITRRAFIKAMASTSLVPLSYSLATPTIEQIFKKMSVGIDLSKGPSSTVMYLYKFEDDKMVIHPITAEQLYKER